MGYFAPPKYFFGVFFLKKNKNGSPGGKIYKKMVKNNRK